MVQELQKARADYSLPAALERLGRRTTFVTIYDSFGANPTWSDVLIHDGEVVAMDARPV